MTAVTAARSRSREREHTLAGTGSLIRFMLRRDRIRLPVWIFALAALTVSQAAALPGIYTSAADRQARAEVMATPAATAITGPGYGFADYTFGAMLTNELLGFMAVFVALMSLQLVVRHTRAEEAAGRAELVRATVVGRHAPLTAVMTVAVAANVLLGVLVAAGLGSAGLEDVGWPGSWLYGAAYAAVGITFAAVAALTAQLTQHPRAASGAAGLVLGLSFAVRAAGDMNRVAGGEGTLSWLSPIGWAQQTRAYVDDRWWPLLLAVAVSAVLVALAVALSTRRDVGAGMVPPRPGPARASAALGSPLALAARQHRAGVLGWSASLLVFGLGYGTLAGDVVGFVEELDFAEDLVGAGAGQDLLEGFLGLVVSILAMAVAAYGILAVQKLGSEEGAGRVEPLLATAVSRTRLLAAHVGIALAGSTVALLLGAAGLGATAAAAVDDVGLLGDLVLAGLVYVPVLWFVVGLTTALLGVVPRATAAAWVVVVYGIGVGMLGGLLDLPQRLVDLSPFELVPHLPAEDFDLVPVVGLLLATAALLAVGVAGFRRRDITTT